MNEIYPSTFSMSLISPSGFNYIKSPQRMSSPSTSYIKETPITIRESINTRNDKDDNLKEVNMEYNSNMNMPSSPPYNDIIWDINNKEVEVNENLTRLPTITTTPTKNSMSFNSMTGSSSSPLQRSGLELMQDNMIARYSRFRRPMEIHSSSFKRGDCKDKLSSPTSKQLLEYKDRLRKKREEMVLEHRGGYDGMFFTLVKADYEKELKKIKEEAELNSYDFKELDYDELDDIPEIEIIPPEDDIDDEAQLEDFLKGELEELEQLTNDLSLNIEDEDENMEI